MVLLSLWASDMSLKGQAPPPWMDTSLAPAKRFRSGGHPEEEGSVADRGAKKSGAGVLNCLVFLLSVSLDCRVKLFPVLSGINVG